MTYPHSINNTVFLFSLLRTVKSLSEVHITQVACGYRHSLALARGMILIIFLNRIITSETALFTLIMWCYSQILAQGGQIFSWGQNKYGQLGLGMQGAGVSTPQVIQSLQGIPFAQISAGGAHSFGLTLSGAIFGWGRNKFGQLGLSDNDGKTNTLDIQLSFLSFNDFYGGMRGVLQIAISLPCWRLSGPNGSFTYAVERTTRQH